VKLQWLTSLLLFLPSTSVLAIQQITSETQVNYAILHQWLHSDDPPLVAWAADFARRTHNAKLDSEMPALLERWVVPKAFGDNDTEVAQRRAITAVLDTLIQEKTGVPIPAINAIAESFPAQASILISRLPLSESRSTLQDWTYGATGTWTGRVLARLASMMLAKDPGLNPVFFSDHDHGPVSFVASVVAASEEELQITVTTTNEVTEGTATGACGDFMARAIAPGWPQVYTYDLVENDPRATAPIVVDLDGDRIVYRRFEENRPWGSCYAVRWLDPSTRHRLIAHWLGVPENKMSWQPAQNFTIKWTDMAAYQQKLGEIIETERKRLQATVKDLHQRGLLTASEADVVAPKLVVNVECEIKPCPLAE
jgi:hypothetical protein